MTRSSVAAVVATVLAAGCGTPSSGGPSGGGCATAGCPASEACNAATGACETVGASCAGSAGCPIEAPVCHAGSCLQCATVADCAPGTAFCTGRGRCAKECTSLMLPPPVDEACSPFGFLRSFCSSDASCSLGEPHCLAVSWSPFSHCVACLSDAECTGANERCVSGDCVVPFPGDGCEAPLPLALTATETLVTGDLAGYSHECTVSDPLCDPDVFYAFTIAQESVLDAAADGIGIARVARLELLSGCGRPLADSNWSGGATGEVGFAGRVLPPGDHLIHLAMESSIDMAYTLRARLTPVGTAPGETCTHAIPIVPDAAGRVAISGDTFGHSQPSPDACDLGRVSLPETVHVLDLPVASMVDLTLTPAVPDVEVGLAIKSDCGSAQYESQTCASPGVADPHHRFVSLPAGRHYVVVTSDLPAGGAFGLTGTVGPWPTNDVCAAAEPLAFAGGTATARGQTAFAAREEGDTCSYCPLGYPCAYSKDVFYRFSTVGLGVRSLDVAVTPTAVTAWTPKLVLSTSCAISQYGLNENGIACGAGAAGQGASLAQDILPEGEYWLQVGGDGGAFFDLTATLGPPRYPPVGNDACFPPASARLELTATSGTLTVAGTTVGADDTIGAACGGSTGAGGGDVVYELKLPYDYRGRVSLTVNPLDPGFDALLVHEGTCSGIGGDCAGSQGAGGAESLYILVPNTSYVWVDGAGGTSGRFTLSATFRSLSPSNDACTSTSLLTPGVPASSENLAHAFTDGTCQSITGPDLYYRLENPAGPGAKVKTFTVTVAPAGFDAGLAVYTSCAEACTSFTNAGASGVAETVDVTLAVGGVGYLGVVSADGARGSFSISAQ